jgi:2'-5' RNA ligase
MPHSISLWFDEGTETAIRELWNELARSQISSKFHDGPYRPHITLSIYEDLRVEEFLAALRSYADSRSQFPITFESLGAFTGSTGSLFLAPRPTLRLLETQREVASILADFGRGVTQAYYQPEEWTPHCTLVVGVEPSKLSKAFDLCQSYKRPIQGIVNRIGIIKNPEEIELHEIHFRGRKST